MTKEIRSSFVYPSREIIETSNHFKVSEFRHIDRMNNEFIDKLVKFRSFTGQPMMITSDYREAKSATDRSQHSIGNAIDYIAFEAGQWAKRQPHWLDLALNAMQFGFTGVGIYFDWTYTRAGQRVPAVGMHVDNRTTATPLSWFRHDKIYYYRSAQSGVFSSKAGQELTLKDIDRFHMLLF